MRRRYDSGCRVLKEVVTCGRIGKPLMLHCIRRNPTVPAQYVSETGIDIGVLLWLDDDYVSARSFS